MSGLFSMPLFSAQDSDSTQSRHVGQGSYNCRKGSWLYCYSQEFFPIGNYEDPVFSDEYCAFLNDFASKKVAYEGWKEVAYDTYFEPSLMEENIMNRDGSLETKTPSSAETVIWRLSFPSFPNFLNVYHYQTIPGREDYIVDGVKKWEVSREFNMWRQYTQWRSHPTVRVLLNYINLQIAAKFDPSYHQKVEVLRNSYLHKINGKDGLLYHTLIPYRGGEEPMAYDEWERCFDTCDELVRGILKGMENPEDPFNEAYYPDLALFYITVDVQGQPSPRHIIEFSSDVDSSLPADMPMHAVCPSYQDPSQALGYLLPEGAPELKIATHANKEWDQITSQ